MSAGTNRRFGVAGLLVCACVCAPLAVAGPARADFETGLSGADYQLADPAERDVLLERTVESGARIVRLSVSWRAVASSAPADPADPADPAYDFAALDRSIESVTAHGLQPLLTIAVAPDFAEGPGAPRSAIAGTWKPDPRAFGQFAQAISARYSGRLAGLPRVRFFQAWNEPNLDTYLAPQYAGRKLVAAERYRRMLNRFYDGVKRSNRTDVVITGGTAPYGDPPGGHRSHPLTFLRDLLCLHGRKALRPARCGSKPKFDVLAHHPIDTAGGPTRSAINPDDASTSDFGDVARILRAAERRHTLGAPGRHQLWATEIWWRTRPPDRHGVSLAKQARYIEQALYLLWRQGAKLVINLQLQDPPPASRAIGAGLLFADGSRKPSFEAFRFPFVTDRSGKRSLRAWGKAPRAGRLVIARRRGSGWAKVKSLRVGEGKVFNARLRLRGGQRLRATVGGEHSLTWAQR